MMRFFLLFSLLVSLAPPAAAANEDERSQSIEPPRLMDSLTSVPAGLQQARAALRILNIRQACSGFFISNDGYFLTAAHCVKHMLPRFILEFQEGRNDLAGMTAFRFISSIPELTLDPGDQGFLAQDIARQKPLLVFAGDGFLSSYPPADGLRRLQPHDPELQKVHRWNEDFVILKFDDHDYPCVPTAPWVQAPKQITFLGFSLLQPGTLGTLYYPRLYLSQAQSVSEDGSSREKMLGVYSKIFSNDIVGFTYASILAGMSGGPVLDENDHLIGLTTVGFAIDPTQASDRAGYVHLSTLRRKVRQVLGEENDHRFFSCIPQQFSL